MVFFISRRDFLTTLAGGVALGSGSTLANVSADVSDRKLVETITPDASNFLNEVSSNSALQQDFSRRFSRITAFNDYLADTIPDINYNSLVRAIIARESAGDHTAASSKSSAAGLMQLIEGTAIRYGLRVEEEADERYDPKKNIAAGKAFLDDLIQNFGLVYGIAAYYDGPGKVSDALRVHGRRDALAQLNGSRKYFTDVLSAFWLLINPLSYGITIEQDELHSDKRRKGYEIKVQEGDTLWGLGIKHLVGWKALAVANNLRKPYPIFVSGYLKVPGQEDLVGQLSNPTKPRLVQKV